MPILAVVLLLSLVVGLFPSVGEKVATVVKQPVDKITSIARTVAFTCVAALLISFGVASLAIPVLGWALIGAGLILLAFTYVPKFFEKKKVTG